MEFMSTYKHLDNLCRDMNGIGVTGYIEDMERNHLGVFHVPGWENDYKQLKHYRWIRNQIAHEDYADEDNMCEPEDTEWLEKFYDRIIKQTDPLALVRKAAVPPASKRKSAFIPVPVQQIDRTPVHRCPKRRSGRGKMVWIKWIFIALFVILALLLYRMFV